MESHAPLLGNPASAAFSPKARRRLHLLLLGSLRMELAQLEGRALRPSLSASSPLPPRSSTNNDGPLSRAVGPRAPQRTEAEPRHCLISS
ncbi:hypothetical protein NL676_021813 [Syzygium grande]|nr:hypothetical protein NL676_021813 [Syzygium grande]